MNKERIYDLIGYKGEYTVEVKKALRKLLKKYHPDVYKGSSRKFELLNSIKKELESKSHRATSVSFENASLDYTYYEEKLEELYKEQKKTSSLVREKYKIIADYYAEYSDLYQENIDNKNNICNGSDDIKELSSLRKRYLVTLMFFLGFSGLYFLFDKLVFLVSSILVLIYLIYDVSVLFSRLNKTIVVNMQFMKKDQSIQKSIVVIKEKIDEETTLLLSLERKLTRIENDIRFYKNVISSLNEEVGLK